MPNISNKFKVLIFLVCVVALLSTINTTYSRYVSASEGVVTTNLARWQIFINSKNVTESYGSSITFTPIIEPNEHVAANKVAPSSKGYFDIAIDPSNVDVSFTYDINFNVPEDSIISDIKVTDYAIVEGSEITDETVLTKNQLTSNTLSDTKLYNNEKAFAPFIIRVYFAWIEGENETMDDASDSTIGNMIANGDNVNFELGVNINFKQYVGNESEEEQSNSSNTENNENMVQDEEMNSTEITDQTDQTEPTESDLQPDVQPKDEPEIPLEQ